MAVLVTRPSPDDGATAAALRALGIEALLAPMLRFEAVSFADDATAYDGVIATSANALRAVADHPAGMEWRRGPLFAVGAHTAEAARALGFDAVIAGSRGAAELPALIAAHFASHAARGRPTLLHLAGADLAQDLSGPLDARGIDVTVRTVYRMAAIAHLSQETRDAFAAGRIDAILHFSRRSAEAFVAAARADGVEITALALPQCCLSDAVAAVMREAGAARIVVAETPNEAAMLEAVTRALRQS
ncbi:MAG: uroporphyrinogen-III synthase [Pseudomonadota bacterium]